MTPAAATYLSNLGLAGIPGWEIQEAHRDGRFAGLVITKGSEIHIAPMDKGESLSRRNIHQFIAPMLQEFGYVTTRVPLAETDHSLFLRVGFKQTWADLNFTYWALTKIPYQREARP